MAESPAELLERAATLIEEYAADATPGPWFYNGRITYDGGHMLELEDRSVPREERSFAFGDVNTQGDACWIVTLNPVIAAPFVKLLRTAAMAHGEYGDVPSDFLQSDEVAPVYRYTNAFVEAALELARRILGEHTEEGT